jgi:hypothetical protein
MVLYFEEKPLVLVLKKIWNGFDCGFSSLITGTTNLV